MRKNKTIYYFMLITMLVINLVAFPAYATDTNSLKDKEDKGSLNVSIEEGLMLGKEAKMQIISSRKEKIDDIEIALPKGIKLIKGNLKSSISSKNDWKNEIVIKIDDPGKYVIDVSSKGEKIKYNININENYAIYGRGIGNCDLEIMNESEIKSQSVEMKVIDSIEKENIVSDNINRFRDSSIQFIKSDDIDEIECTDVQQDIVDIPLKKETGLKNTKTTNARANSNLIAYDIVPLSAEPYMTGTTYTFDFQYANSGDSIAYNVKTGIYLNGNQKIVATKDMNPMTIYTARVNLTIHNPGTVNLEMRVDEESGSPDVRKEAFVWVSKIGKGIDYKSLTTPNDSSPYEAKEPVMMQSFIRNIGTEETGDFDLTVYRDGEHLGDLLVPNIEVGKYKIIQVTHTEYTEGDHTFKFVADEDHVVDSDVHERILSGYWNGIGADLISVDVSYDGTGQPQANELEEFIFKLKNNGTKDINTTFNGKIEANAVPPFPLGQEVQYTVNSLGADDSLFGRFSMYLTSGQWAFTHKVDVNDTVEECNESNNSETYTINVLGPQVDGVWYSQIEPDNWDATKLDKLFVPNSSIDSKAHTPFEWNIWEHGEYVNPNGLTPCLDRGHINKWGCVAASLAMVLENVGAETEEKYYDFRNEQTDNMEPDPFTITYANIGYPSIRSEGGYFYIDDYNGSNSPVYMSPPNRGRSEVAGDYGYDIYNINLEGKTTQEKVSIISEQLAKNPEGIMARISSSHTFVINNVNSERSRSLDKNYEIEKYEYDVEAKLLTPELEMKIQEKEQQMLKEQQFSRDSSMKTDSDYDDYFIVTDPGTQQTNKGDNVVYNESWTYGRHGGIEELTYIEYID